MRIEKAEIKLNNIKVHAYHGVYPEERKLGTDYIVNVRCELNNSDIADGTRFTTDNLNDSVDYSAIYNIVIEHMKKPVNLIETVIHNISNEILNKFPMVSLAEIEIEKNNPPLSGECKSASVLMRCIRTLILLICMAITSATFSANQFTIMIDAGHGGKDPGAQGKISDEKDINLKVALEFGRLIENNCPEVKVLYTRKTDVFIELNERANLANRNKANLFVSIHTNALPAGRIASGFETYTLGMARADENLDVAKRENAVITYEQDYKQKYEGFNPNSAESYIMFEFMQDKNMAQSVDFAKLVQTNTCRIANRVDKGVHQAGFLVLRKTSMPSCLVELGFISTREEEDFLNTDAGIYSLARGLFAGFVSYRNKYDKNIVIPYKIPESLIKPDYTTIAQQPNTTVQQHATTTTQQQPTTVQQPEPAVVHQEVAPAPVVKDIGPQKTLSDIYSGRSGVFFRIQLFATKRIQRPGSQLFLGLENTDYYQEGDLYKYTYGDTNDYSEITAQLKKVREKFPEAYVIAIKNGEKIQMADALKEYNANTKKK